MSVEVVRHADGWQLRRGGQPLFVRGAVGSWFPERLSSLGGNALRGGGKDLDAAQANGLLVLCNLPLGKPRAGFDYTAPTALAEQLEATRQRVRAHRDHPALLAWALGNELEIHTTPEERAPVWRAIDDLAAMIHDEDPRHPVMTVIGDAYRHMLHELDDLAPHLDLVGLNAYQDMLTLPEDVAAQGWTRPYMVTEFGPRGHWQVAKTPWGQPVEDNSTQKAEFYRRAYRHAVLDRPQCLGSFAFYWCAKQEKTHTWYGMFLPDGSPTEAVEAMSELWTGQPAPWRCPRIGPEAIAVDGVVQPAGRELGARLDVSHPDGLPLRITWDLRPDVANHPGVGGDWEPDALPIDGAILAADGDTVRFRLPAQPGPYRLFAYAHDERGLAATANLSFLAE